MTAFITDHNALSTEQPKQVSTLKQKLIDLLEERQRLYQVIFASCLREQ